MLLLASMHKAAFTDYLAFSVQMTLWRGSRSAYIVLSQKLLFLFVCLFVVCMVSFISPSVFANMQSTLSFPESIMETCTVVLTFESVDEILWCDHSNETSSAVLLHGAIYFSIFSKLKFGIFLEFWCLALLAVKGLTVYVSPATHGTIFDVW